MLDIRKMKPPKGRILIKLLGALKEELVDGIIIPSKDKMAVKEGLVVKLPDDLRFNDLTYENPPERVTNPEARGLRHLAFKVDDIEVAVKWLKDKGIETEPIRFDEYTQKRMTFFRDPDDLPLELHE